MASVRPSLREMEERECVLHSVATWNSWARSIVIKDALKSFHAGHNSQSVFFYSSQNTAEPARSDPKAILASLARQLSCLEPGKPLLKAIKLYGKKEAEGFTSGSLRMEGSCPLIMRLIEQYSLTTKVIDTPDECDPGKRRDLLKTLEQTLGESSCLVKIFVLSRDDHDIVFRLQRYPSLEIKSDRNSDDIAVFVKYQTERLIEDGGILQYSDSQTKIKELIVDKMIKGATGMQVSLLCLKSTMY
ncbi:hypothetical protein K469DRAFT_692889 [Zopfia rhizophila CBS 207.26]|uniref:Nephrocystin 3-like N-terminal domain-containing protein n=1 Tax=Zopfia rhizophila CBS 207.26 TaxID=1314779 RepID=A0A6A6DLM3_9PEZI|nr:hypothetical protein K469DRAFT_692889 [Zopfia rhizophila CBS 207.26]